MFYSQVILARKGPLGKIWLAAHFDKKLTKNQIFSTDITDSVENVLNPSTPLALRVSGHLMLGIVRIYSRKVKYLMSDCTEAMWKIKLAFRPGNADLNLDLHPNAQQNIDDPRYFGHINPDSDFPELADTAFSQSMLTKYDGFRAARVRTIGSQRDTTQDDMQRPNDLMLQSKASRRAAYEFAEDGVIPDTFHDEASHRSNASSSKSSHVSEIEIMRGEKSRQTLSVARSSLSTMGGRTAAGGDFNDELPAFTEEQDFYPGDFGNDFAPLEDYQGNFIEDEHIIQTGFEDPKLPDLSMGGGDRVVAAAATENDIATELGPAAKPDLRKTKNRTCRKKIRLMVDQEIEYSNRFIKERMTDVSAIVRRFPGDPLPPVPDFTLDEANNGPITAERSLEMPSLRGLCPELQELFAITMTSGPMPFPLSVQAFRQQDDRTKATNRRGQSASPTSTSFDVELARKDETDLNLNNRASYSMGGDDYARGDYGNFPDADFPAPTDEFDKPGSPIVDATANAYDYGGDEYQVMADDPFTAAVNFNHESQAGESFNDKPLGALGLSVALNRSKASLNDDAETRRTSSSSSGGEGDWNARTALVFDILKTELSEKDTVMFNEISAGASKRLVAASFLELLQLKTWGRLHVEQSLPFGDIAITATGKTWA